MYHIISYPIVSYPIISYITSSYQILNFWYPAVVLPTFQSDIVPCYSAHSVDAECSFETFLTICQYSPGDHTVRDPDVL